MAVLLWEGCSFPLERMKSFLTFWNTEGPSVSRNSPERSCSLKVEQINLTCPCSPCDVGLLAQAILHTMKKRICWDEYINYGPYFDIPVLCLSILRQCENKAKTFIILVFFIDSVPEQRGIIWESRTNIFPRTILMCLCFFKHNLRC